MIMERYAVPSLSTAGVVWAPDSRRWIWAPDSLGESHLPIVLFKLGSSGAHEIKVSVQRRDNELLPSILLGFTGANRVLSTSGTYFNRASTRSDIVEFDISQSSPKARRMDIALPVESKARPLLSPRGDRILWVLEVESGSKDFVELWMSDIHGERMRGIGFMEVQARTVTEGKGFRSESVAWRPDGKEISFVGGRKLYILPALKNAV